MKTRRILALSTLMGLFGCQEVAPSTSDAMPEPERDGGSVPPACTSTPAYSLGPAQPAGAPPITVSPTAPTDGEGTLVDLALADGALSLRVELAGTEHTVVVPDVDEAPPIAPGSEVQVTFAVMDRSPESSTLLVNRDSEGIVAAYLRSGGYGSGAFSEVDSLSSALGIELSVEPICRTDGGQCGRSAIEYAILAGNMRVEPGTSGNISDALELRSLALLDDADRWAGSACAIGLLVAAAIDVVRR